MNTRPNIMTLTTAALLLGLGWAGSANAQQSASTMPGPEVDRASCAEIKWHRDLLRNYPWVGEACQEAIIVDGKKWARFEAEFQRIYSDGAITSDFRNNRGQSLGSVRLMPAKDQRVLLDGRNYQFSDLQRGQILNFYAPEDVYAFTTTAGAPAEQMAQIVAPTQTQATPRPETRMAQVEPVRTTRPTMLPETAGTLPVLMLGGMLSLLIGLGMTVRRSSGAA